jgi:hypothetical protein
VTWPVVNVLNLISVRNGKCSMLLARDQPTTIIEVRTAFLSILAPCLKFVHVRNHRFEDMILALTEQPAEIKVEDYPIRKEDDANAPMRLVTILVGDQVIEASCNASACTQSDPDSIDWQAYQATAQPNSNKSGAVEAVFGAIELIMLALGLLAVGHCL